MRPITLRMSAFGPYGGVEKIDFRQLQERGLFLITGATGAGKTTVFDAICYALYGKCSGKERNGENLRSDFAAPEVLTEVELEFFLQEKRYRLRRIPSQLRQKARGSGFTEQKAEAELLSLDDVAAIPVSGVKEVNERVIALFGLNYEQFKQTVMISQGEFRELIMAESKERESILQRLFGVEAFRRIQEELTFAAKGLEDEISGLLLRRQELLQSFDGGGSQALAEALAGAQFASGDVEELVRASQTDDEALCQKLATTEAELTRVCNEQAAKLALGEETNRRIAACEAARNEKARLESLLPQQKASEAVLHAAKRAALLDAPAEACRQRFEYLRKKEAESLEADALAAAAKEELGTAQALLGRTEENCADLQLLRENIVRLENLTEKAQNLARKQCEAQELEAACAQAESARSKAEALLEELGAEAARYEALQSEAAQAALTAEREKLQLEKIERQLALNERMAKEKQRLIAAEKELEILKESAAGSEAVFLQAEERRDVCRQSWLHDAAGRLAQSLKPGESCPVCGSLEHPGTAIQHGGMSEDELRSAELEYKRCAAQFETAKERLREAEALIRQIVQTLQMLQEEAEGGETEWNEAAEEVRRECLARLTEAQQIAGRLEEFRAGSGRIKLEYQQAEKSATKLRLDAEEKKSRSVAARLYARELEEGLPEDFRGVLCLQEELKAAQIALREKEALQEKARENWQQAMLKERECGIRAEAAGENRREARDLSLHQQQAFAAALAEAGFADEAAWLAARLEPAELAAAEKSAASFNEAWSAALLAAEISGAETRGLQTADLLSLREELCAAEERRSAVAAELGTVKARFTHNGRVLERLNEQKTALSGREAEFLLAGELSRVARGQNEARLSFERYVLASFFDDIIVAANWRLAKMTAGRYEMSRRLERGKGNAQSGLEIDVLDQYTGRVRSVKTLSGGESFQASLALALGLADVVQAAAGGIRLDTMFIDEGFGTLDPEALDNAIRCLLDLQAAGRLVGIISHVPELKASINARLEVESGRFGSKTRFVVGLPGG